jgi:mono/diheme cytochrome c family protein
MRIHWSVRRAWMAGAGIVAGAGMVIFLSFTSQAKAASAAKGKDTFDAKCAMCHAKDGSGSTPMGKSFKVNDLRSKTVQKKSDAELAGIISKGKSPMPGYGSQLSKDQIGDLVAYIRELGKKK